MKKGLTRFVCAGIIGLALAGSVVAHGAIVIMEKTTIVDQYDFYLTLEVDEEFGMIHLIADMQGQEGIYDPDQSTFVGGAYGGVDTWVNTAWSYRYDWLDDVSILFKEYTPAPPSEADTQPVALLDWVWNNNEKGDSAAQEPDLIARLLVGQGVYGTVELVTTMSVIPEDKDKFVFEIPEPASLLLLGTGLAGLLAYSRKRK